MSGPPVINAVRLHLNRGDAVLFEVGANGITHIEQYDENGQMAPVPFIRVWRGEDRVLEVSKAEAVVYYAGSES